MKSEFLRKTVTLLKLAQNLPLDLCLKLRQNNWIVKKSVLRSHSNAEAIYEVWCKFKTQDRSINKKVLVTKYKYKMKNSFILTEDSEISNNAPDTRQFHEAHKNR